MKEPQKWLAAWRSVVEVYFFPMSPVLITVWILAWAICTSGATLLGATTSSFGPDATQALTTLDPLTGALLQAIALLPTFTDSIVPNAMAVVSPTRVAVCTISPPNATTTTYCAVMLDVNSSVATMVGQWCSTAIVLDNVGFNGTDILVTGFDMAAKTHRVYVAHASGVLVDLFVIPQSVKVQVALSVLMPHTQKWFLVRVA
jgi:hypothetical protein